MKVLPSKQISAFLSVFDPDPRLIYVVARILSHPPEHDQPESEKKKTNKNERFFSLLFCGLSSRISGLIRCLVGFKRHLMRFYRYASVLHCPKSFVLLTDLLIRNYRRKTTLPTDQQNENFKAVPKCEYFFGAQFSSSNP